MPKVPIVYGQKHLMVAFVKLFCFLVDGIEGLDVENHVVEVAVEQKVVSVGGT